MTSKERLLKAFRREIPDRVPVAPMVNPGWLKLAGTRKEEFIRKMDLMMDIWINTDMECYLGEKAKTIATRQNKDNKLIDTIFTPKGELTRISSADPNMLDWVLKPFLEDESDIEKFLSVEYLPLVPDMKEFSEWENRIGQEGAVMALISDAVCLPGLWMSPERFMLMCVDNFNLIKKLLDTASERINDYVEHLCKSGVGFFRIAGPELASQTLMGPGWFSKLVAPYDKKLVDIIHKYDGIAFCHCHGKVRTILDEIAGTGIDALSPMEDIPNGDISLEEAKKRIGDRVCLVGNLDDMEFIGKKSREEIETKSLELIKNADYNGGFVLGGSESGVYTEKILEGFLYMAEVSAKHGNY